LIALPPAADVPQDRPLASIENVPGGGTKGGGEGFGDDNGGDAGGLLCTNKASAPSLDRNDIGLSVEGLDTATDDAGGEDDDVAATGVENRGATPVRRRPVGNPDATFAAVLKMLEDSDDEDEDDINSCLI